MTNEDITHLIDANVERYPVLVFFRFDHLPPALAAVSAPFAELAATVATRETRHPAEAATALRKLLEAKDAAVRAAL